MNNFTVCDKFKPTILEGQLCYSLDIDELKEYPTKSGKSNGLLLLLDTKPYQLIEKDRNFRGSKVSSQKFKVFVNTLALIYVSGSECIGRCGQLPSKGARFV